MQAFQRVGQKPEHEQPRSLCAKSTGNTVPRAWCRKTWDWMLDISIGYGYRTWRIAAVRRIDSS